METVQLFVRSVRILLMQILMCSFGIKKVILDFFL